MASGDDATVRQEVLVGGAEHNALGFDELPSGRHKVPSRQAFRLNRLSEERLVEEPVLHYRWKGWVDVRPLQKQHLRQEVAIEVKVVRAPEGAQRYNRFKVGTITPSGPSFEVSRRRGKSTHLPQDGVPHRIGIADGGLDEQAIVGDGESVFWLDEYLPMKLTQVWLQRRVRRPTGGFARRSPKLETGF